MTTEQEAIAEQVIQKHKDNNGQYNWKEFHLISTAGAPYTVHIIKAKLIEKGYIIDSKLESITFLKENGLKFISFENERQIIAKQKVSSEKQTKWNNAKTKLDVIRISVLLITLLFSGAWNIYQFISGHKYETIIYKHETNIKKDKIIIDSLKTILLNNNTTKK